MDLCLFGCMVEIPRFPSFFPHNFAGKFIGTGGIVVFWCVWIGIFVAISSAGPNMGACCSKEPHFSFIEDHTDDIEYGDGDQDGDLRNGDCGARVRLHGSSKYISMYTQQGRKGVNQDAMTVWEDFTGEKGMIFCGVFDGHGPSGHKVARSVRETLPSMLSSAIKSPQVNDSENCDAEDVVPSLLQWEDNFIRSFGEMDEELNLDCSIDSFCSGSTAVTIVKKGDLLVIGNLGDSRAVLCTRGEENQLVPVQLTVDLKPNIQSEAERIKNCRGRVFAMDREPNVFRIWMPEEDYPGLAMSRCFGDFCLKDYGLTSIPKVASRKLTDDDEFVVLATDGVWDILTNNEVIKIVASAKRRSMAAKLLVCHAVQTWRSKHPGCSVDDCTAICFFFKNRRLLTKSLSEIPPASVTDHSQLGDIASTEVAVCHSSRFFRSERESAESLNDKTSTLSSNEEACPPEEENTVDSITKLHGSPGVLTRRKTLQELDDMEAS
ncbi:probable protein phosphatase 2C 65 isoform X2 [Tripterygium wilfordii]|nr:probable protein phosphatase 2C 65 isoform X2 [Tripterygium wilfordii]